MNKLFQEKTYIIERPGFRIRWMLLVFSFLGALIAFAFNQILILIILIFTSILLIILNILGIKIKNLKKYYLVDLVTYIILILLLFVFTFQFSNWTASGFQKINYENPLFTIILISYYLYSTSKIIQNYKKL